MRVHIIGAGLAGLAAAVRLADGNAPIRLYEAAPRGGGRCRSYHDPQLDCVIDNGNHLLMSGNHAVLAYLEAIGARDRLAGPSSAAYPFLDVQTGAHWTLQPSRGRIPWWLLDARRRVPGTTPGAYLSALKLLQAGPGDTVAGVIPPGSPLYRNFWEPLTIAALNTAPEQAAAILMRPVLLETFLKGADACRPLIARDNLADTLVDPAVSHLAARGAEIRFGARVRGLSFAEGRVSHIETDDGPVSIAPDDTVIVAVPAWIAETLVPGLTAPPPGEAIVNVHYRLPRAVAAPGEVTMTGVIGGLAQWVFVRGDLASVTISAAGAVTDEAADIIATRCWADVARVLGEPAMAEPPARVIKEKRATFAQTPAAIARRPQTQSPFSNLLLAGDWTATGLPATIEGAVRSGFNAAEAVRDRLARAGAA
ncbi:MAG: FAD-dependent oxidoreductase [Rhodospirillaceae bacterium]|nr:FAD-dependent oxidoreductase [Rhodospirillaceae bacterium]